MGGYYKAGNADMTADTVGHIPPMNLASLTTYRSLGDNTLWWPTWLDNLVRGGVMPNIVLEHKVFSGTAPDVPAPNMLCTFTGSTKFYGYTQTTSGVLDPLLTRFANAIKALPYRVNLQLPESEVDTYHQQGGTINGIAYTWEQLDALAVQAADYMRTFFAAHGVANATYTLGNGGWNHDSFIRAYWSSADAIQFNAYNHGTYRSPYDVFNRTYAWLPELPTSSQTKPVYLAEWGCGADLDQDNWIRSVPSAITQLPRIAMMNYFNSAPGWGTLDAGGLAALIDCYNDPIYA